MSHDGLCLVCGSQAGGQSAVGPMKLVEIRRYPVKSLLGEQLTTAEVDQRGLLGDRLWAVCDADGKLGSGKNTRRFRRMDGLFTLRGHVGDPVPVVELPDGRRFAADDPAGHDAVSEVLGRRVTIEREADVQHHDGPVSLVSTAALQRLHDLVGEPVDPVRFRRRPAPTGAADAMRVGSGATRGRRPGRAA